MKSGKQHLFRTLLVIIATAVIGIILATGCGGSSGTPPEEEDHALGGEAKIGGGGAGYATGGQHYKAFHSFGDPFKEETTESSNGKYKSK